MQKLGLTQTQQGKLSPKQVQFVQMLQIPAEAMLARVQEEMEQNPTLEEAQKDEATPEEKAMEEENPSMGGGGILSQRRTQLHVSEEMLQSKLGTLQPSWHEKLLEQVSLLSLSPRERTIADYLLGSFSADGYLRVSLEVIVQNLSFTHYLETDTEEVASVLRRLQRLEPAGIGARDLRECLLIQLGRKPETPAVQLSMRILTDCFAAFSKKNYRKIITTLKVEDDTLLKKAIAAITQLSPKPILAAEEAAAVPQKRPDFIVRKDENGVLTASLYHDYTPRLRIKRQYRDMLQRYGRKQDEGATEVTRFVKEKIQRAQWFIESIQKRRETLLRTMEAILKLQKPFFEAQDEQQLRPLFMRHIAEEIQMDISTVSRVVRGKRVATDFGTFPLKYFFSEPITTTEGKEVSSRTIKTVLKALIEQENKQQPYTDEELMAHMKKKGYVLARRTIAKYRGQLGLPVARMRKEL